MATKSEPVGVELITPDRAREYLGRNTHNRSLRAATVEAYARDIAHGDWAWNGESIKFDANGVLLDGQHRLAAIITAGKAVQVLVVRDLPSHTQETMDGGAKRKFSDVLALRGEANYITLATVTRAVTAWEHGGITARTSSFTNAELFRTLEKYPWLRDGCAVVSRATSNAHLPATVGGLCWWLFLQLDPEDTGHFFDRLCSEKDHHDGDPIYALRRALKGSLDSVRGNRNRRFVTAITIKAWNKFRDGEPCSNLRFRIGGASPESFPAPY